jgi:hypothetical protein
MKQKSSVLIVDDEFGVRESLVRERWVKGGPDPFTFLKTFSAMDLDPDG